MKLESTIPREREIQDWDVLWDYMLMVFLGPIMLRLDEAMKAMPEGWLDDVKVVSFSDLEKGVL